MAKLKMGVLESKFADIVWANVPTTTGTLVGLAEEAFGWKRTTTYTVLKRLCDRDFFNIEKGKVTAKISRTDYYALQACNAIDRGFSGSMKDFFLNISDKKELSAEEAKELKKIIGKMVK